MYKTQNLNATLSKLAGEEFDVSVENVGRVLLLMKGRADTPKSAGEAIAALQRLRDNGFYDNIASISITGRGFDAFPEVLMGFRQLRGLSITFTSVKSLPDTIAKQFPSLVYLDVRWNKLALLPASVGDFSNLSKLKAYGNDGLVVPTGSLRGLLRKNLMLLEVDENAVISRSEALQFTDVRVEEGGRVYTRLVPKGLETLRMG